MNIMAFKLITGETIVANVVSQDLNNGSYIIKQPLQLDIRPVSVQQMGMVMMPWTFAHPETDQSLSLSSSSLMHTPYTPSKECEAQYISKTTSIIL